MVTTRRWERLSQRSFRIALGTLVGWSLFATINTRCGVDDGAHRKSPGVLKAAIYEQRKTDALRAGPAEPLMAALPVVACAGMGLGAGGSIRQSIETPVESPQNWVLQKGASAWVHIANSVAWQQITGERPPMLPPSAADYTVHG